MLQNGRHSNVTLNIPPKLEPYVSDYKINVFEVAWLSDETISKFKFEFYP
ncbi:MAG: hypothetical protein IKN43_12840 [Selenomonadaceae bacterium]|nr:hypothetical protein [Selenomonadaceae bacterium]